MCLLHIPFALTSFVLTRLVHGRMWCGVNGSVRRLYLTSLPRPNYVPDRFLPKFRGLSQRTHAHACMLLIDDYVCVLQVSGASFCTKSRHPNRQH